MKFSLFALLSLLLCGVGALLQPLHAEDTAASDLGLVVVGSDFLQESLQPMLIEFAGESDLPIHCEFHGSLPALGRMRQNTAALAVVAVADQSAMVIPEPLVSLPLAYQLAVVVVRNDNPVMEISLPQLAGIFGTSPEQQYSRWGELGITGALGARSIQPLALDKDNTTSLDLFKYKALRGSTMKSSVTIFQQASNLTDSIGSDAGAVAITNFVPTGSRTKVLSVSTGEAGDFAFGPTRENIYYGDYPLRVPFHIVFNREKIDEIKPILEFLLSDFVAEGLSDNGFVPAPENVRRRSLMELDNSP